MFELAVINGIIYLFFCS